MFVFGIFTSSAPLSAHLHMFLFTFSAMSMMGLFLIALGTGGIKPCVAAFGGDQFSENQVRTFLHFCVMLTQRGTR